MTVTKNFIHNIIKFKNLIKLINTTENFEKQSQRRANSPFTQNQDLMYDSVLYTKFIKVIKTSGICKNFSESLNFSEEDLKQLVIATYKNYHSSSCRAVIKFIEIYQETIQKDLKGK